MSGVNEYRVREIIISNRSNDKPIASRNYIGKDGAAFGVRHFSSN